MVRDDGLKLHRRWLRLDVRKNLRSSEALARAAQGDVVAIPGGVQEQRGCDTEVSGRVQMVWVGLGHLRGLFRQE